jgi:hypothetical protein
MHRFAAALIADTRHTSAELISFAAPIKQALTIQTVGDARYRFGMLFAIYTSIENDGLLGSINDEKPIQEISR